MPFMLIMFVIRGLVSVLVFNYFTIFSFMVVILQPLEMNVVAPLIRVSMLNVSLRMIVLLIPLRVVVFRVFVGVCMRDSLLFMSVLSSINLLVAGSGIWVVIRARRTSWMILRTMVMTLLMPLTMTVILN